MLTEEEEADLRELSREIVAVESSPFEPAIVGAAFASPMLGELALTMQGWIDLSHARSPLLEGIPIESEDQLQAAAVAFGLSLAETSPEEGVLIVEAMERAVAAAFAASLPMRPPKGCSETREPDGFGGWLPLQTCLIAQLGFTHESALKLRVEQAMMFIAAHRRNEGWSEAGTPYALRDLGDVEQSEASQADETTEGAQ